MPSLMTDGSTVKLTILINAPKGVKDGDYMIGLGDEKIAEGPLGTTAVIDIPCGYQEILVLIRSRGVESWSSTTPLYAEQDMSLKIKYGILNRTAKLVENRA